MTTFGQKRLFSIFQTVDLCSYLVASLSWSISDPPEVCCDGYVTIFDSCYLLLI